MGNLSKENPLQREAFELYYQLGEKRSLKAVAKKVDRTERTVAGWSRSFNWVDRVIQREIEEGKDGDDNGSLTASKTSYRIMLKNLLNTASRDIASGKLSIRNVADFERVVKLDLLLMGEAPEKVETIGSGGVMELSPDVKARLDEIAKLLKAK